MSDEQWYFDPADRTVSRGRVKGWDNRMGPYPTRETAERALEIARRRTESSDAEDDAWND